MIRLLASAVALYTLTLAACAGADKRANNPSEPAGESLVRIMEGLAAQIETEATTCDEFAALLGAWIDREREPVAQLVNELDESVDAMSDEELERLDERLTRAFAVLVKRASECEDHEKAQRALANFDALIDEG